LEPLNFCQLLGRSPNILQNLQQLLAQGYRTFKLKIALDNPSAEIGICEQIFQLLPPDGRLRLDANGGLTFDQAKHWLSWGETQEKLEFIEQPLAPQYFSKSLQLQQEFQTKIALDESVSQLISLQDAYCQGWRGAFVIKVAIAGFPSQLQNFCQTHQLDCVISTVFETAVGRQAILNFAQHALDCRRALGMGGTHWFGKPSQLV
jgi:o-succinylbenzoate synthase